MSSSSPYNQQSSDQEHAGGAETSEEDGEAIEVDPLTFCQPEMSLGGQGDFEESFEDQESDEEVNDHDLDQYIEHNNLQTNDNDSVEGENRESSGTNEIGDVSMDKIKAPTVQLTAVNKIQDKNERPEKETISVPKVTITPIGPSLGSGIHKKDDSPISVTKKRKLGSDIAAFVNGMTEKVLTSNKEAKYEPVLDHPIELRKLLFGDLAQEMCITVSRPGTNWQKVLSPLDFDPDSSEVHRFSFARNSSAINGKLLTY